jgi:hypothetical protein
MGAILIATVCRLTSAGVAQCLRTLAPTPSGELTLYPACRTRVRSAANDLPVRGGAVLPLLTTGNASMITS